MIHLFCRSLRAAAKSAFAGIFSLLVVSAFASLFADPISIKSSGTSVQDFVPKGGGWFIREQVQGDLNNDHKPDAVIVIARTAEKNEDVTKIPPDSPRILLVLLKTTKGYELKGRSDNVILCRLCGGVFGDPLEKIEIERGTFVVRHYGGSRFRWYFRHRFRLQQGRFFLIGSTSGNYDSVAPGGEETDTNLLTGASIKKTTNTDGVETVKEANAGKKPLVPLEQFSIEQP
ncbi:MAG: hypothetical protein HY042_09890 [Spirochaetia bacterium]|nr:hypothetical protein [Spirochaetia bacterium]